MHELGVTFYVIRDVKEVAEANDIEKVNSVTLDIGEVSGVIHDQLIDCWNWAKKKEPVTKDADLIINQIDAVTLRARLPNGCQRQNLPALRRQKHLA